MSDENHITNSPIEEAIKPIRHRNAKYVLRYLLKKVVLIALTIFIGIFLTVFIINRPVRVGIGMAPAQLDREVQNSIQRTVNFAQIARGGIGSIELDALRAELEDASGINEPILKKTLIYTINAMKFDWGRLTTMYVRPQAFYWTSDSPMPLNQIVLTYLPATMILVVTSYLIIIVLGLPIAMKIAQRRNSLLDRFFSAMAPLSSIPSWVIGLLLIFIFAVEFKWLPVGGMLDNKPPVTAIGYIPIVLKHMVLPVTAIVLSLLFQLVYTWRSVFITFGEEDYVDLGISMGLPPRKFRQTIHSETDIAICGHQYFIDAGEFLADDYGT